ncbi:hypothetical protein Dsin_022778 [Dipteronia sinensis]|uniref:Uncharacterized protein n=1 Tax=Dipteronia sinensis TaxID=43782 RepID=A0AAE0A208_9ROSI|nr:hypothetical protein Dsin_022778 [Dipteronia sinensis]
MFARALTRRQQRRRDPEPRTAYECPNCGCRGVVKIINWCGPQTVMDSGTPKKIANIEISEFEPDGKMSGPFKLLRGVAIEVMDAEASNLLDKKLAFHVYIPTMVILLPMIEPQWHVLLVREWLFIVIAVYIAQMRPVVDAKKIAEVEIGEKSWTYAEDLALNGKHKFDAHYVKAIRAIKEAAAVWGDDERWFVRAAVKFAGEFPGWGGFEG